VDSDEFDDAEDVVPVKVHYRTFVFDPQKGAVVISSGRTECMLKFQEVVYDLTQAGYSVYIFDHRGQGFSGRMTEDTQIGHVDTFADYVSDLKTFVDEVVKPSQEGLSPPGKNLFLVAHSMGGCIASLYVEKFRTDFDAAVLCSPMHGASTGFIPRDLASKIADWKDFIGRGKNYAPGKGPSQDVSFGQLKADDALATGALTHDEARYERVRELYNQHPEVKVGGPSNMWVRRALQAGEEAVANAGQIGIPVLLIQAGSDSIVEAEAQNQFRKNMGGNCEFLPIDGGFHELLIESDEYRKPAMTAIERFLKDNCSN
jgi:lysophospholipase